MNYQVKDLSLVEKEITVHVPSQEVDVAIESVIGQERKTFEKDGFRKGKVSDDLIFQEKKDQILAQAANHILSVRLKQAQTAIGIVPINRVQIQSAAPLAQGEDFEFSFVAEVIPEMDFGGYEKVKVEVKKAVVTEQQVDQIINSLREQLSTLEKVDEVRLPQDEEVVAFDFEALGEFSRVMGMSGKNHKLELGTGQTIDAFETMLKSLKPGESATDRIPYPADFPNKMLAGKEVETKITLKGINRKVLPEVTEAFAWHIAKVRTVEQLREFISKRHFQRLDNQFRREAQRKIVETLLQQVEVPLAPTYVKDTLEEMIGRYTMAMQQRGMTTSAISEDLETKRKEFLPEAESAARRKLLLLMIAKKEKMKLPQSEVEEEITRQAEAAETDIDQFMMDAYQSGLVRQIKDELMMGKVVTYLYESADKTMVEPPAE